MQYEVPPAQGSVRDEAEIDLRGIIGLLRRQLRLIAICVLVVLGLAGIALFVLKPVYTATTLVLVDPSKKDLLASDTQLSAASADNSRVESEVEIVRAPSTLLKVIRDKGLVSDPEFGVHLSTSERILTWLRLSNGALPSGDKALNGVLARVRSALSVRRRAQTYLIAINFSSHSPQKAADLANAVANTYISDQLQAKVSRLLSVRDILRSRISDASSAVSSSEEALDNFVFAHIDRISSETGNPQLVGMAQQLKSLEGQRAQTEQLADLIAKNIDQADYKTLANRLGLDAVNELEQQRERIAASLSGVAEGSQQAVDLRKELNNIETQISQKANDRLSTLRQTALDTQSQAIDLRKQVRSAAISSDLPTDLVTGIYELQQNAGVARNQYQTLLSRLREVEAQVDLQVADSRVVSAALAPFKQSFPNTGLILALAGLFGLGLGIGLAFLNENYIGGFTSLAQVEAVLRTRVLTAIPRVRSGPIADNAAPADTVVEAPLSGFAESIRRVRVDLDQYLNSRPSGTEANAAGKVIMVSSAVPGEGKTTTALALAKAYALSGQRTLLVDADMRRPSVHKLLHVDPEQGLFEYLSNSEGAQSLASVLSRDETSGLDVLVGARGSTLPTDQLLASHRFAALIDSARRHFDVIILDTPPAGPIVDAQYLATHIDYLLFVIRWASTPQTEVRVALTRLVEAMPAGARSAIVLNQQDGGDPGYFSGYAGYYQGRPSTQ